MQFFRQVSGRFIGQPGLYERKMQQPIQEEQQQYQSQDNTPCYFPNFLQVQKLCVKIAITNLNANGNRDFTNSFENRKRREKPLLVIMEPIADVQADAAVLNIFEILLYVVVDVIQSIEVG